MLIYKHEDYQEWALIKMVRVATVIAEIGQNSTLRELEIKFRMQVHAFAIELQDSKFPSTWWFLSAEIRPGYKMSGVQDLLLLAVRTGGDFTPAEIDYSFNSWTFQGEIMAKQEIRQHCVGSFRSVQMASHLLPPPVRVQPLDQRQLPVHRGDADRRGHRRADPYPNGRPADGEGGRGDGA